MAITSQNGWSANDRSMVASYTLPGGKVALRKGDASVVLLWVANEFHRHVEPLEWPGNWGYAERPIRGSTSTLSNHASGTSLDLNAPAHPLGARGTFTSAQVTQIRRILAYCEGTVRWGGDYRSRPDEMHFELNANAAAVRRVADKIRGRRAAPQEDELSQAQVDQIIAAFRRDLGHARNQIMTRQGVANPEAAPAKLPPEQLAGIDPARRVDVGYARDQLVSEFAALRALVERQNGLLEQLLQELYVEDPQVPTQERNAP
jgi:hypothetical protein